ncbi:hypothetical protein C7S13_6219 [Burkholderia cepacia]|nr:hypothetical protein [Burkholderia cepacia]
MRESWGQKSRHADCRIDAIRYDEKRDKSGFCGIRSVNRMSSGNVSSMRNERIKD